MMSLVVGVIMLFPFTLRSENNNAPSHTPSAPASPATLSPVDTPGTDEYIYNEMAHGMR